MPKVSVIIPSYNHGKYISEAIQSVLDQTFKDFEILITDDGSTDNTIKKIKQFKDSRIKLFCFKKNQGAAIATNNNLKHSKGKYIAMLNSDDVYMPNKLEEQVHFLDLHNKILAVFSYAKIIDQDGKNSINKNHFYYSIFQQRNKNRFKWLKYFFYNGNCLCHPSVLARSKVYKIICPSDQRYCQLGDFDRWIKTTLNGEIYIIPRKLIKFRVKKDKSNISIENSEHIIRCSLEHSLILRNYLKIKNISVLTKIFPEIRRIYKGRLEDKLIPFYISILSLKVKSKPHQNFALNTLFNFLSTKKLELKLNKIHNFTYKDFIKLTGTFDSMNCNATTKIKQQKIQITRLKGKVKYYKKSKSWKITKPLRKIKSLTLRYIPV